MGAFIVNTKDGPKLVVSSSVKGATFKAGKPGEPAKEAVEAKEADPGVPANPALGLPGRPPTPEVKAQEATPAVEGEPDTVTFETEGGSIEAVGMTLELARDHLNRS